MNELDQVRVRQTVMATPWFEADPIEIQSGWRGTIVAQADTPTPGVEFTQYRERPYWWTWTQQIWKWCVQSGPENPSKV